MRWTLKSKPLSDEVSRLANELSTDINIASLLVQRGINTYQEAKEFFRPDLKGLHDPFLMQDMQKAVDRIEKAIDKLLIQGCIQPCELSEWCSPLRAVWKSDGRIRITVDYRKLNNVLKKDVYPLPRPDYLVK